MDCRGLKGAKSLEKNLRTLFRFKQTRLFYKIRNNGRFSYNCLPYKRDFRISVTSRFFHYAIMKSENVFYLELSCKSSDVDSLLLFSLLSLACNTAKSSSKLMLKFASSSLVSYANPLSKLVQ